MAKKEEVTVGAERLKPKRKRVWTKVFLALILGILIGGGLVIYYYNDNNLDKNKLEDDKKQETAEEKETTKVTEKELSLNSYQVKKLISGIHFDDGSISSKTLYIEDKTLAKDLDSSYLDNLLLKEAYRTKSNFSNTVSIKDLEQARLNLFGENYEIIIPTDKEIGLCPVFSYDVLNKTYQRTDNQCSLTSDIKIDYNTVKAVIKDKEYIHIYEVVAFIKDNDVYKKIDGSNNLSEKLENVTSEDFDISDRVNDLNQYKYNFKYNNDTNNYVFESIELVKK